MLKKLKKSHLVLIAVSLLILIGSIATTAFLLFTNYQNIRLFKQAQDNFQRGDAESLSLAEVQLHRVIREDDDNEAAYIMLGEIAGIRKNYPAQVYYCYMAYRLNPYQDENKAQYIKSLCYARYFDRLENFLSRQNDLPEKWHQLLLYAAGHNGNINKHKKQFARRDKDNRIGELALLLFEHKPLKNNEKFNALARYAVSADPFLKQEILAAQADLYLADRNIEEAGKILEEVYALNEFAFAPVLGRYYANYRSFGKALEVYEKYLKVWNDPEVAMQMAEICCLLNRTDKIAELRNMFQSDSGSIAMLCCYYFDALTALAEKKMDALKDLCAPLRKNIKSPLAAFLFLCADLQGNDLSAIRTSYADLLAQRDYLNLKNQADELVSGYFKRALADAAGKEAQLLLAQADKNSRRTAAAA